MRKFSIHAMAVLTLALLAFAALVPLPARAQSAEEDRGYLQGLIEDNLSDAGRDVRISGFSGALSSRATVTAITIGDADGIWLTLKDVVLSWNRSALLAGRIEVEELSAGEIILARLPATSDTPKPEASGFALPDLPVSVQIGKIAAERVVLESPILGQRAELSLAGSASLADGEGEAQLEVARLDRATDALTFTGTYSNATDVLTLSLALQEGENGIASTLLDIPGRPSVALEVQGSGPLSDFSADIRLATDGQDRLSGNVTLTGAAPGPNPEDAGPLRFSARLGGDIAPVLLPAYRDFFGNNVQLDVRGSRSETGALSLETLRLETAALRLTGQLDVDADGWPQRFDLEGVIAGTDNAPVVLPVAGAETTLGRADLSLRYDRAEGDGFSGAITVQNYQSPTLRLADSVISVDGALLQGDGMPVGEANGAVRLQLSGIEPQDENLARAIGSAVSGTITFDYLQGTPLQLPEFALTGADYGLTGKATIEGLQDALDILARGDAVLTAADLSRFAGLAGVELEGGATLRIKGSVAPLSGAFDLEIGGEARDIAIGQPNIDPLIGGTGRLDMLARRDETGTIIERFVLITPETALTAAAVLKTGATAAQANLRLKDVAVALPDVSGPASLSIHARQDGDVWSLDANAAAPGGTTLEIVGDVSLQDGAARLFKGRVAGTAGALAPYATLAKREIGGSVAFELEGEANLVNDSFSVLAQMQGRDLKVGQAEVDRLLVGDSTVLVEIQRDLQGAIFVPRAEIASPAISLTASGEAVAGEGRSQTRFDARLPDADLIVPGLTGAATLRGTVVQDGDAFSVDAQATGPGDGMAEADVTLRLRNGALAQVSGQVSARARTIAPFAALAGQELGGSVDLRLEGQADLEQNTFAADLDASAGDLKLGITPVDRLFAGRSTLTARLARDAKGVLSITDSSLVTPQLELTADTSLSADGSTTARFDGTLRDTSVLAPGLSGPASLNGTLRQDDALWSVALSASAPGGVNAQIDGTVTVDGGTPTALQGRVQARADSIAPYAALVGQSLNGSLNVTIDGSADLTDDSFVADVRADTRNLALGIAQVDQLLAGDATLVAEVTRDANGLISVREGRFNSPQLRLDAQTTLAADGTSTATFDGQLRNAAIFVPGLDGPVDARGTARSQGTSWIIDTQLQGPGGTRADIAGTVAADGQLNLSVQGAAPLGLADRYIAPRSLSGLVQVDLQVNGPPALTSLSGSLRADGARLSMPTLALAFGDIAARIDIAGGAAQLSLSSTASTGGSVSINGPISLSSPFDAQLLVDLRDLGIVRDRLLRTTASGRIAVRGPLAGGATISGDILMGDVEVRVPDGGGAETAYIEDLRHVNEPADVRRTRARAGLDQPPSSGVAASSGPVYGINVLIRAPARIFVRGRGLDAELGGQLRLRGTTNNVIPEGRFDLLRGRLDILGKRIDLSEGYATMQGDFDPTIRLVAETQAGEVTVRVIVEGYAREPEVTFESIPDLPQDEVLSQLLFGREIGTISALQAAQLASAVATLAGKGGEGIVSKLRSNFGLDDLDVTTNEEGVTEARIGKYISEKVYTDVTADTEGKTKINLNIQINPAFTARGSVASDGETGIGLFFEKNY